jgi:son of sevenless-like protein
VQAFYDYYPDDKVSLSFNEGDVIRVFGQLESGWWDGALNGVRGWFPSNYCQFVEIAEDNIEEIGKETQGHGNRSEGSVWESLDTVSF